MTRGVVQKSRRAVGWALLMAGVGGQAQGPVPNPVRGPVQALRAIDDPATGTRWLLVRATDHSAGPGVLMRMGAEDSQRRGDREAAGSVLPPAVPIIRGGDPLIVLEETAVAEARLDAVALGPAAQGAGFEARLRVTGQAVHVIALGPGRARLAPSDPSDLFAEGTR